MSFNLSIAGAPIPTDAGSLKSFEKDLNLDFHLDSTLKSLMGSTLADVPASKGKTAVSYSGPLASWRPADAPVRFGLRGGAGGSLQIVAPGGAVVSFADGLDSPKKKAFTAPSGLAYVNLSLNFNISADVSGSYSSGPYGVSAALDESITYAITFCKAFPPTTNVQTAIAQTFESFVLPFNQNTIAYLNNNDFLLYEFDGNLHLSFGVYAGLNKVFYAGRAPAEVLQAQGSPLATLTGGVEPLVRLGATLAFAFQYATTFEGLLTKTPGSAQLHVFRSANRTATTSLTVGLTFDAEVTGKVAVDTQTVQQSMVNAASNSGAPGQGAITQVLQSPKALAQINSYVSDMNSEVQSWLNRGNGFQTNMQVAIETSTTRSILASYDIDLTAAPADVTTAWNAAIAGDFVAIFQSPAVTLETGSGLENAYQQKTSFSLNFFNLWKLSSWDQFSSTYSLAYAGNNIFHFAATVELSQETEAMGVMRSIDMYFAATADATLSGSATHPEVDLHLDLTAQDDPNAAGKVATMLSAIEAGPVADAMARNMHAFAGSAKKGTVQLHVTIGPSSYAKINCDAYSNGKPLTSTSYNDQVNWKAFAQAADDLNAWPQLQQTSSANYLETFPAWVALNCAQNGSTTPNRLAFGDTSVWPDSFPNLDDLIRFGVSYSMRAGQHFMNFCADLVALTSATDVNATSISWVDLLKLMADAIKKDLGVDFIRPSALAIIRLCGTSASTITGPISAAGTADHFVVTMTF
ncbi:MAG: hypothetical protein WBE76_29640 [Terracidiphilus sp.]